MIPLTIQRIALLSILSVACTVTTAADRKGSRDHPMISRYAGSEILKYEQRAFDEYGLLVRAAKHYGGKAKNLDATQPLEGKVTRISYIAPPERTTLEVFRNYQQSLQQAGFEEIFLCKNVECGGRNFNHAVAPYDLFGENYDDQRFLAGKLQRGEGDIYVSLYTVRNTSSGGARRGRTFTQLDVIELKPMESNMVTIDANAMAREIDQTGRVALYGLYFDTAKATIKPESKPTLEEIAKLMQAQPELRVVVVGHTDNQGKLDYNMDLSQQRARAVVQALTQEHGIAAERLQDWGVGFLSPVASNRSEEGRAKNRRVELVEQ